MDDLLNPAQRNSVTNVLKTMEEDLRQTYQWLHGAEREGILFRQRINISDEKKAKALDEIAEGLDLIAKMAESFQIQPHEQDLSAVIRSSMSVNWVNLMNSMSKELVRYGAVDPQLEETLDPSLMRLAHLALRLANLV